MLAVAVEGELLALELLLHPALLGGIGDVHVLNADRAGVGVAQHPEDVPQFHPLGFSADGGVDAIAVAGHVLAIEIPDREAVGGGVELGVALRRLVEQRVGVGDEVTPHPVLIDQSADGHLLGHRTLAVILVGGGVVDPPLDGVVGHAHVLEGVVVESVLAQKQLVQLLQEQARLGPLDDPVVIGRSDGDDLGDAELSNELGIRRSILGRVANGPDSDDCSLPRHQPRHRLKGSDRARVGEGDRRSHHVVDSQLVGSDLGNELFVSIDELGEGHGLDALDDRDNEGARAVGLLLIYGDTEVDVLVANQSGLAGGVDGKVVVEVWNRARYGPHHCITDDVGEADLAPANPAKVVVQHPTVDFEQLGRDLPEAGGGWHLQAGLHVGNDPGGNAADRFPCFDPPKFARSVARLGFGRLGFARLG